MGCTNFIKNNLFCIMDFISKPFFKNVCKYNNCDITFPQLNNNNKIDVFIMNHISFLDMLVAYYSTRNKKSAFVAGHALKKISGLEIYDKTVFEIEKGLTKEDTLLNNIVDSHIMFPPSHLIQGISLRLTFRLVFFRSLFSIFTFFYYFFY